MYTRTSSSSLTSSTFLFLCLWSPALVLVRYFSVRSILVQSTAFLVSLVLLLCSLSLLIFLEHEPFAFSQALPVFITDLQVYS